LTKPVVRANAKSRKVAAESPGARARRAVQILDILEKTHPEARCALDHRNPFELAVATILSAQCTDERVNIVTPVLFDRFPTAQALADAHPAELEEIIRSTGFFRAKAKSLIGFSRALVERGGELPRTVAEAVKLPGVGRKTANVVLGGLATGDDPLKVEAQLMPLVPRERWTRTTDLFIFHGRKICDARRPLCGQCPVFGLCRWEGRQAAASALRVARPTERRGARMRALLPEGRRGPSRR
jgi:endonuclease-3